MKKLTGFIFWFHLVATIIGGIFEVISFVQIFVPFSAFDIPSKPQLYIPVSVGVIILLLWWIGEKELADYQNKTLKPILRIKSIGCEAIPIYKTVANMDGMGGVETQKIIFASLFIEVFNKQKNRDAKRVWANVEWRHINGHFGFSHQGSWDIANPEKETRTENLQYIDLDSNGHPERLYFACRNTTESEEFFYGLAHENVIQESRDNPQYYRLDGELYNVKIILIGNNDVKQEFKYIVSYRNGRLFMLFGELGASFNSPL